MKKINYLGIIGLGCGALLLTACGGGSSHTLKCEVSQGTQKNVIEIAFNDEETKAESVSVEMTMDFGDEVTDEQIDLSKESLEKGCESAGYKNCKVTTSGKKIVYSFESKPEEMGISTTGDIDAVKAAAEEDGYTCKKA